MRALAATLSLAALALFGGQQSSRAQFGGLEFLDFLSLGTQYNLVDPGRMMSAPVQGFAEFREKLWPEAAAEGVSRATFDAAFAGVTPDPWVIEKANHQPEFVKPPWDYVNGAVTAERIANGRAALERYRAVLDSIEATYGVSRHVVVSIWGIESSYGAVLANPAIVRPVIRSLATLAFLDSARSKFGRTQLLAALTILQRGDTSPDRMAGSWAGAMGHTQFIPTTYIAHAVDFDGDGRRDIWDSVPDALASTASYLAHSGWQRGETWGYEVHLAPGFDFAQTGAKHTLAEWTRLGVRRTGDKAFPRGGDEASLVLPAGARGPAFLMLKNFSVIKRYNNADAYALGVGHLADRLMGGEAFVSGWPVDDRTLAASEREELQRLLMARGFDTGGIDGQLGPRTRGALRAYQASIGVAPDGFATKSLLDRLRANS